jgi:hypothetical protein
MDVLKSLLRSTALAASDRVRNHPATSALTKLVQQAALMSTNLDDAALTAAVARAPGIVSASVAARAGQIRIDASFEDDRGRLQVALWPVSFSFAPMGAKEVSFAVEPAEAILDPRVADICAALAAEIAHAAWRVVLGPPGPGDHSAMISRETDRLVADLRSAPAVRRNRHNKLAVGVLEALKPQQIEVLEGELRVAMTLEGIR